MAIKSIIKKISGPVPVISVCSTLLFTLTFLIVKSLSEDQAGRLQFWITLIGIVGICLLIFFLLTNGYSLYRQYSRNEIGSILTSKLVVIFFLLTVIPFSLIYFFSIQFLNKGVDSWFDVRIEQTVKDSLLLSKTALEGIKEEITSDVEGYAKNLRQSLNSGSLLRDLDDIRELEDYVELSLYTDDGRILAFSSIDSTNMLPDTPVDEVFSELRLNQTYTLLEPIAKNTQQLAAGTQKISEGDYGSHLPVTTGDELGILTDSFNHMSSKIDEAQKAAVISQTETERQRGYLEAVLTNLSSGVFSFDTDQCLQISNSAASDILGVDLKTKLGSSLAELSKENQQTNEFFKLIATGIASGQSEWQDEITLLGKHGRQILIMRGTLLTTDSLATKNNQAGTSSNSQTSYVVVFDDVTNLIQAQRDAAWGEVARRLAHEIKNPLTPIQLSAERIKNKLSGHVDDGLLETIDRSTRTIVQQVESMKEMVNAFSSYAQPVRAKLVQLNVNQLLRDVIELHASSLQNIDLKFELEESLPEIKANASALRQVFNNLIINASHAVENIQQGQIIVRSEVASNITGKYIDIVFIDNGIGIPEDIRDSLFDPYVSSKAKGSGLGLAIVKRIVEEHSGSVWTRDAYLDSENEQQQSSNKRVGTEMHLRLPINAMQTYRGNRGQNTLHSESDEKIIA